MFPRLRLPSARSAWILLPVTIGIVLYLPTLRGEFLWDDNFYLSRWVGTGTNLYDLFFPGGAANSIPYYRPLANLSGLLLYQLGGPERPWVWHAVNLAIHGGTTAGVYHLLRWWAAPSAATNSDAPAATPGRLSVPPEAIGATLFAAWPANVETVSWISARTEGLMVFFLVWAVVAHLRARDLGRPALLSGLLFLCSLLSKEVGIVFLPLAAAATFLLPSRPGARRTGARAGMAPALWLPHVLAYVGYSALRSAALAKDSGFSLLEIARDQVRSEAIGPAFRAWGYYVQEAFLFGPGAPFMEYPVEGPVNWAFAIVGLFVIALAADACRRAHLRPWTMAVVWFVLCLGPPIALAAQPLSVTAVASRYLYAPSIGVVAAVVLVLRRPAFIARPRVLAAISTVAVVLLAHSALARQDPWLSARGLWTRAVRDNPESILAHMNLGLTLYEAGEEERGMDHLRIAAYRGDVPDKIQRQELLTKLAEVYMYQGRYPLARVALAEASKIRGSRGGTVRAMTIASALSLIEEGETSDESGVTRFPREILKRQIAQLEPAARLDPTDATSRLLLALLNEAMGEPVRAMHWYEEIVEASYSRERRRRAAEGRARRLAAEIEAETDPRRISYFRAQAHEHRGELDSAIEAYQEALAVDPERLDVLIPLAELMVRSERLPEAIALMEKAAVAAPENGSVWYNLGFYRQRARDPKGAAEAFGKAIDTDPRWWKPYYPRGIARESTGDLEGAAADYQAFLVRFEGSQNVRDMVGARLTQVRAAMARAQTVPANGGKGQKSSLSP